MILLPNRVFTQRLLRLWRRLKSASLRNFSIKRVVEMKLRLIHYERISFKGHFEMLLRSAITKRHVWKPKLDTCVCNSGNGKLMEFRLPSFYRSHVTADAKLFCLFEANLLTWPTWIAALGNLERAWDRDMAILNDKMKKLHVKCLKFLRALQLTAKTSAKIIVSGSTLEQTAIDILGIVFFLFF